MSPWLASFGWVACARGKPQPPTSPHSKARCAGNWPANARRSGGKLAYGGQLEVTLCGLVEAGSAEADVLEQARGGLLETLFAPQSPFPRSHWLKGEAPLAPGVTVATAKDQAAPARDTRRDVAISTRGVDLAKAQQARQWFADAGLNVYVYDLDNQSENMDQVYEKIRTARLTLLNVSHHFLQANYEDNPWTLRELAEAVLAWGKKRGRLGEMTLRLASGLVAKEIGVMHSSCRDFDFNKHFPDRARDALLVAKKHFKARIIAAAEEGFSTELLSGEQELYLKALPLVEEFSREFAGDKLASELPCACYDALVPPPKEDLAGRALFVRRVKEAVEKFRQGERA